MCVSGLISCTPTDWHQGRAASTPRAHVCLAEQRLLAGAPGFALRAGLKANSCPADEGERARPFRVQAELCVPGVLSAALEVSPSGGRRGHVLGHWQQRWRRRPRTSGVAARVRCGRGRRAPREYHEAPQEAGWTPCCATDNSPVLALPGGAC